MLTVTITCYKRPELLARSLESIAKADVGHVKSIIISVDWHSSAMYEQIKKVHTAAVSKLGNAVLIWQPKRLGIANHPRALYNRALVDHDPYIDKLVALEEDTIVAPDAFRFAYWALDQPGYQFVNLAPDTEMGFIRGSQGNTQEDYTLRSPYGWAFRRGFWGTLEPQWNGKVRAPYGWDWQVRHLAYREGWKALTPEIARVYNTGREGGTYDTPENWDRTQRDVKLCEGIPDCYNIVGRCTRRHVPDWITEEIRL